MTATSCGLMGCVPYEEEHEYELGDYEGPVARWRRDRRRRLGKRR